MARMEPTAVMPLSETDRITSLDILRGFALLGILIMNIQSYSMIGAAYLNPSVYGDLTGLNKIVWMFSHIFADMKFISIFSMLFGAGIVLMTRKAEEKSGKSAGLHYRRTFWLLIIGLIHAYLLWYGDILVTYAVCGFGVYLFRKVRPNRQLTLGLIFVLVPFVFYMFFGWSMPYWPEEAVANNRMHFVPGEDRIISELAAYRGGWLDQMEFRVPDSLAINTFLFLIYLGWRCGGMMLIGMALYKWGVLTAERSNRFYINLGVICFAAGFPLILFGINQNFANNWVFEYSMFFGSMFNYIGSIGIAIGYVCIIMLICKADILKRLTGSLAAVGRMAFTNYLLHTLICTTLFYGHGFGLYGKLERTEQITIVAVIWIIQLVLSPLWLKHFRFGPMEWLWRSLTYWKPQPIRIDIGPKD